jgi:hypothetical protein
MHYPETQKSMNIKSERAISLARPRPLAVRFLEDPVRRPGHDMSSRNSSGPANSRPLSRALPLSHQPQKLSRFHPGIRFPECPSPVAGASRFSRFCFLRLEDCSSVGFDNSPETLQYKALPNIFQCGNGGLIVEMLSGEYRLDRCAAVTRDEATNRGLWRPSI